jgi:GNAT superfamily N-acetyltransferase
MTKRSLLPLIISINKWILPGKPMKLDSFHLTVRSLDANMLPVRPPLVQQLRKLTLHARSGLNRELDQLFELMQKRPVKAEVLLAYHQGKLVGWALLSREHSSMSFPTTWEHFYPSDGTLFEIYVDPAFRRKGIGTKLIQVARRKSKPYRLCIAPWDYQSRSFYGNFQSYGNKVL